MRADLALTTMTVGELHELDTSINSGGSRDSARESRDETLPQHSWGTDIMDRLSVATAAKLAGQDHEPVMLGDYELERLVGIGGMGRVFAARERTTRRSVALKLLHRGSASALLSLKREFRTLAEVEHPNLVGLDALVVPPEGTAFFTMELIEGLPFVEYVRGRMRAGRPPNVVRLRRVLAQLVSALDHLHARGFVHRDLKPSNVMVTREGRVVVLDFGLVEEFGAAGGGDDHLIGTPAYMAPEQAALESAGPAADLYAVGVMLFECLCGARPFSGDARALLQAKRELEAPDPAQRVAKGDAALARLCRELLAREPARRPSAAAVLDDLRAGVGASPDSVVFVGRRVELDALDRARADQGERRRPLVVLVHGPSGQGKSSLLSSWASGLGGDELVLRGRCLERESVPYKGLDAVVDALAGYLRQLPGAVRDALCPADVVELVRLFPVLETVWPEPGPAIAALEPAERRERAVSSLREVLARLARTRALVLALDDFHWADADSAALLEQLLDNVNGPPILVVSCFRQPPDPGAAVARLRAMAESRWLTLRELELPVLRPEDARELVALLVDEPDRAAGVLRRGAGNPRALRELARELGESAADLDHVLAARLHALAPARRRALNLVAVAAGPIERRALVLAGCDEAELDALIDDGLLRPGERDHEQVELDHELLAQLSIAELDADALAARHRELAEALAGIDARPELLAEHFERGGVLERAFVHAERAASEAMKALAFHRASTWFERCLAWLPQGEDSAQRRRALERRLVEALVNSGRLHEGAELLLAQAADPQVEDGRELRIRAMGHLLAAGHMQEGLREASELLTAVGLEFPRSRARMLFNVLNFRRRVAADLALLDRQLEPKRDALTRERARVCEALAMGVTTHDGLLTVHFCALWRRLAIEIGDRAGCARALGINVAFASTAGWRELTASLTERARSLAGEDELTHVWLSAVAIHVGMNHGEFRSTLATFERLRPELEARVDTPTMRSMALSGATITMVYAGRYRRAIEIARREVELGVELGDLKRLRDYSAMLAWSLVGVGELAEAEQVLLRCERLEPATTTEHYLFADLFRDFARIRGHLRAGEADEALARARRLPASMKRDGLWHVASFRNEALAVTACAELQIWLRAPTRAGRRRLRKLARELARGTVCQQGNAALIEATLAEVAGELELARRRLAQATDHFDEVGAEAHLACARLRRAALVEGPEAQALRAQARDYMVREAIDAPAGLVSVFAPGPESRARAATHTPPGAVI